jgi:hypothetical protein
MGNRILVATRKGLFDVRRKATGWGIARTAFLGDILSQAMRDPRDGTLYVAQSLGHFGVKLQRSTDDGKKWTEIAAPAFPKSEAKDAPSVEYLFSIEAGGKDEPGVLWCGTVSGGLFRSADKGASWTLNEALWNVPSRPEWGGGGFNVDKPGIDTILVDPRDSRRIVLGISTGGVWQTRDGGRSWRNTSKGLYAEYMPPARREDPNMQDVHRIARCAANPDVLWLQHHNGVFRSTDGAETWREVKTIKPAKFGFAVAAHPKDPKSAWFVPGVKDECRIPVGGKLVVARTRDGAKSFKVLTKGLPQKHAYDLVLRHGLDIDATGKRLAMGSSTGHLWISENGGDSWKLVAGNLPPIASVRFA